MLDNGIIVCVAAKTLVYVFKKKKYAATRSLARLGELTFLADQAYISNYQSIYIINKNAVHSNVDIILLPNVIVIIRKGEIKIKTNLID